MWVEEDEKIGIVATNYFKNLFKSSNPSNSATAIATEGIFGKLFEVQIRELDKSFTLAEVEIAMKGMPPLKAPGEDGLQALFYQRYWDVVGRDTTRMCLKVLNEEEDIGSINKTLITLIPKIHHPKRPQDFRPISL